MAFQKPRQGPFERLVLGCLHLLCLASQLQQVVQASPDPSSFSPGEWRALEQPGPELAINGNVAAVPNDLVPFPESGNVLAW